MAFVGLLLAPQSVEAQAQYDNTFFMHGFNDNSYRWTYDSPISRLSQQIDLGIGSGPSSTTSTDFIDNQARQMRSNYLHSGRHVLVGHSSGGIVARRAYLSTDPTIASRDNIGGIITVATPHQGAPIVRAANRVLQASQYRMIDSYYDMLANKFTGSASTLEQVLGGFILDFVQNYIVNRLKAFIRDQFGVDTPAAQDLRDGSSAIQALQVGDDVPHANVYGVIEKRNAAIKVAAGMRYEDPQPWIDRKNRVKSAVKLCSQMFYNAIIKTSVGKKCHQADDALGSFDDRWNDWTHGPNKSSPFDGFIPKDHSQYPGLPIDGPGNFRAADENHGTITRGGRGVAAIAGGMEFVRMRRAVPSVGATITGPSSVEAGTSNTWSGTGSNGTGTYVYGWRRYDTATNVWTDLGSTQTVVQAADGNFTLELTVTSGTSNSQAYMDIRVTAAGCGTQLIC